ncbi:uncharacterized protein B0H18DRAFT_986385 [Fomitopsis serialis]|uniref:uncharacterized protein n=1 Tax=Fomitopsis serialis TaxID=139415 RepID=UPI002008BF49|nr:uncharacterized protein B0H18DRAFT_986385 [Neoantrodia serialis]KAH9932590.1 hypothetical protein B0H18DRAFT_986385 [Neoantrodia serialis]
MAGHTEESIALLNEGERDSQEELKHVQHHPTTRPKPTLSQWISAALTLFVLVDLLAYLFVFRSVVNDIRASETELEFRAPTHDPIENVPRVAALVNSEEPVKVYPLDEHRWLSAYGTVTPLNRHLRVSATMHTILQFRVMDYGMERPVSLDLCAVDVSHQIDPLTLSWSTRPPCRSVVGTLHGSGGEEVRLPEFSCKWGSLYTYEVSCAAIRLRAMNGTWGVFMYQFQTV